MTLSVAFHPEAAGELVAAAAWYDERRSGLGRDLEAEVERAVAAVVAQPLAWPSWRIDDRREVRRFLLPRFPYAVVYLVAGERIVVLAVAHTRRRPGFWARRAP